MNKSLKGAMQNFLPRLIIIFGTAVLKSFDFLVAKCTSNKSVYSSEQIAFDQKLTANLEAIYHEYKIIYQSRKLHNVEDFYKVETEIGQDENWKVFPLVLFNNFFINNLNQCPQTHQMIREIGCCTSAMFSVLHPDKHILPHRGLYKGIIRVLFTIEAPENGRSWMMIDGKKYVFERGQSIYFDETFEHEVKNESDEYRVVLYMDIYRALPFPLNLLNTFIFRLLQVSPFVSSRVREYQRMTNTPVAFKCKTRGYRF